MSANVPTVTLNSGVQMPILGFGVFQVPDEQTEQVVSAALAAGYRAIDTAASYGNEEAVGRAIGKPALDQVGDLLRGTGSGEMSARAGKTCQQLPQCRLFPSHDAQNHLGAAARRLD